MNSKASKLPAVDSHTQQAIGVFDSGIGGLSVLQAMRAEMPHERFIYWSDSAFAPYGERSDEFVIDRSHFITEQLIAKGNVKTVVVACNSATAVAIESLRRIRTRVTHLIEAGQRDLQHLTARVRALSPAATLERGYAIVTNADGEIIRDASTTSSGDFVRVRVAQGAFEAQRVDSSTEES